MWGMSYVTERVELALKVLERAAAMPAHRLAGYAANAEFWAKEVRHCRELLDGYLERHERMKAGTEEYLQRNPLGADRLDSDTRTTRSVKDSEIQEARRRLDQASRRFFGRMEADRLIGDEELDAVEKVLRGV